MTEADKKYLDSLDDELFLATMLMLYNTKMPIWEKCTQEEYEKYHHEFKGVITFEDLTRIADEISSVKSYRAVPIYHNGGGGILDQIQICGKEPDGYYYEKLVGYKDVLIMGSEMIDYCMTRECMKPYFKHRKKNKPKKGL